MPNQETPWWKDFVQRPEAWAGNWWVDERDLPAIVAEAERKTWNITKPPLTVTCSRCNTSEDLRTITAGDESAVLCEDCYSDQVGK